MAQNIKERGRITRRQVGKAVFYGGNTNEENNEVMALVSLEALSRLEDAGNRLHAILLGGMTADYDEMTDALGEWRAAVDA